MTIHELLSNAKNQFSLDVFGAKSIAAVEGTLSEKNGKYYLKCRARGKDVIAKPEEIIRQLWLHRLEHAYKYPIARLAVEYPITFGRDSSKRADIVVFDADRPTVPYVIVEVKQPTEKGGKDQLKSYCHATGAPLALWSDGCRQVVWHRKNPNYFVIIPDLPTATQTIEDIAGQPWTIETLVEKEKQREAEGLKARSLRQIIEDLEDEVLANAGVDVFEEVFKLIFTKLYDELACHRKWKGQKYLRFRNQNTATQLKAAIQALFDEAKAKWGGVFPGDDKIKLTPDHLQVCIGSLEEWKLFNSNLDVVDDAFEYLVNKSSKGEKGQYFTPRWVIDMCVKMLKLEGAVGRDLLFIERNLDFLRPGGRMAVVLPQGRFNNSSDERIREFIADRGRILAVVGLHPNTFKPHTGTKTSVIFVQKWNDAPKAGPLCRKVDDYNIFFATQRKESKDTSGDKIIAAGKDGKPLRDTHGHWVVQHDLFSHDGLTDDGIAEAFAEFAKKEKLSFFV